MLKNNYFIYFQQLSYALNQDIDIASKVGDKLEEAGFVNIQEVDNMLIGDWPKEDSLKEIRVDFRSRAQSAIWAIGFRELRIKSLCVPAQHKNLEITETYFPLYIYIAQKHLQ